MVSSVSKATKPGRPDPEGAAENTYTHGPLLRRLSYAGLTSTVLLAALISWMAFSGTASSDLIPTLVLLTLTVVNGYRSAGNLLSTYRLTEDKLVQERPLHATKEVSLAEIRRIFIGGQTVEIHVSPGPEPDLEFQRQLEDGDELIEKLAERLPPDAEIEHPSGELAGRLGGRA